MSNQVSKIKRTGILSLIITFLLFIPFISAKAQDSLSKRKELLYRFTMGMGIGTGYSLENDAYGIVVMSEFAVQRENNVYALGIRRVEEFEILGASYPANSNNSLDITYGKVLTKGSLFSSISAGIAGVQRIRQGKYLYGGGWLGGGTYERITLYAIGVPISAKFFWIPKRSHGLIKGLSAGFGLELFANIHAKSTFWGINLCSQFGKLKSKETNIRK